jgi:hypothetical protein
MITMCFVSFVSSKQTVLWPIHICTKSNKEREREREFKCVKKWSLEFNKMRALYVLGLSAIPRGCMGSEYQKPNVPLTATLSIKSFVGLVTQKTAGLHKHKLNILQLGCMEYFTILKRERNWEKYILRVWSQKIVFSSQNSKIVDEFIVLFIGIFNEVTVATTIKVKGKKYQKIIKEKENKTMIWYSFFSLCCVTYWMLHCSEQWDYSHHVTPHNY